ncbi:alpha-(1,3)-fucosyltransferase C [Trichonephila clavipes]|nr:alpha-(1,3)-fucosyltransferase C [Trichonephila clavipes]
MEKCPVLRRLPRRMVLCLHFTCAILGACALFTLYLESENAVVSTAPSDLTTTKFNFETDKLPSRFQELYPNNGNIQVAKVVPPSWSWTSKDAIPSPTSANKLDSDTLAKNNSAIHSSHHHAVYYDKTKYIYLTSVSTTSTNRPPRVTYRTVKSTPQPKIETTCHSFSMQNSKLILLWTPFFGYWGYFPSENFQHCDCRNCEVTTDRSRLSESDAVIFHARDMSLSDLPSIRYPHQRWVFYCLESPPYSDFPGLQYMKNMFNWTMTYRTNSDIITQYGTITRDEIPEKIVVHCVIHKENLEAKNITPVLNEVLRSVTKCINYIKANAKCERLFRQFCENKNAGYVRLLPHTQRFWRVTTEVYVAWRCPDGTQHAFCWPILAISGQSLASNGPVIDSRDLNLVFGHVEATPNK